MGPASHVWQFRPFRNHSLQTLQAMLADDNPAMKNYNNHPFDPFAIARLRIGAFEKSTVMQYIDNLIAWGDHLFTLDTWEYITAAQLLYTYAYDLLGTKPEELGECSAPDEALNFNQIKTAYPDGIPQFLIDLEHFTGGVEAADEGPGVEPLHHAFNALDAYFCVPENSNFMSRWDTVQDRLYKIDHSMNIEGVVRTLPLFQPPINPLDLVRAAAAGNNIQALAASKPQLSPYRFHVALATARWMFDLLIF